MKKLLTVALVLLSTTVFSQARNRRYEMYYYENYKTSGQSIYPTSMWLRNDTLYTPPGAIVNVIAVQREDSTWSYMLLRPLREPLLKRMNDSTIRVRVKPKVVR